MAKDAMVGKTVELWDGYEVTIDEQLFNDFDFTVDLAEARKTQDLRALVEMYMALIGGAEKYETIRDHITKEHGYFAQDALIEIIEKINGVLPKSGNRAQRRSWKSSI